MQKVSVKRLAADLKAFLSKISIDCWVTCLYFLCMPFTVVQTPLGSLLKVITMPVVAVLGVKIFLGKTKTLQANSVHFIYGAYIILCFAQLLLFRGEEAKVTTSDMVQAFLVLLLISMRVYNEEEQKMIENIWIIVGIICAIVCITSTTTINQYENRIQIYILGYEEDVNQYPMYFTMPLVVAIKRIIDKSKLTPLYAGLIVAILYSVLKLGSRGGLIGIVCGIFACILFGAKSLKSKIGIMLAVVVVAVVVVLVFFPLLPEDVQQRFTVESVVETGGTGRVDIWKFSLNYTFEKPERIMFGSGLLSTYSIFPSTAKVSNVVCHNQFIQTFFDQGIFGLALYIATYAVCIGRNIRKNPYYAAAMVAIFGFSMSLTMYVLKPYINVLMMCAMCFESDNNVNVLRKDNEDA